MKLARNRKNSLTLLEVLIGLTLLLCVGALTGTLWHRSIEKKRFFSNLQKLQNRIIETRLLSMSQQADWKASLFLQKKEWMYVGKNIEELKKGAPPPLHLGSFTLFWEKEPISSLNILFTSSGEVYFDHHLQGTLTFLNDKYSAQWKVPALFQKQEAG